MTWNVIVESPARRAVVRLPPRIADAVFRFMAEALAENPYRVTKPLTGQLAGYRSGYIGISFRIIVRLDDDTSPVHVHRTAHRADAYRP
jgi:mRNA interferase RelE/StbE